MDYIDEIIGFLELFYEDITVGQLKTILDSIEIEDRKQITDYGSLVWAVRH